MMNTTHAFPLLQFALKFYFQFMMLCMEGYHVGAIMQNSCPILNPISYYFNFCFCMYAHGVGGPQTNVWYSCCHMLCFCFNCSWHVDSRRGILTMDEEAMA